MNIRYYKGYVVYENGDIVSPNGRLIKPTLTPKGYLSVRLKVDGKWKFMLAHSFIAQAWLGERKVGYEVDHKNHNRADNRVCNLQYLSKSENNRKSYTSGNRDVKGFQNANCKSTPTQIFELCELLDRGVSVTNCHKFTGVNKDTIHKVRAGKRFRDIANLFTFNSRFND